MRRLTWLAPLPLLLLCCGPELEEVQDDEDAGVLCAGKADSPSFSPCVMDAVVAYVNDPAIGYEQLHGIKITSTAAKEIVKHRNGADAKAGTADDDLFDDLAELDAVKYVGPAVMKRLASTVEDRCAAGDGAAAIFSPMPYAESHLTRIAALIDGAAGSIDIAQYNLTDSGVLKALGAAVKRGVKVRFLSEDAHADAAKPAGTKSAALEALGVNVRYVTKILHHKFMLVDGPRADLAAAATARLVTGSANWSSGGATRFDENTVFLGGIARLALAYQAEFNFLWAHSSDFVGDPALPFDQGVAVDRANLPPAPDADAVFTSDNFTAKDGSTTFKLQVGKNTVADTIVKAIQSATKSIHIASGHLRSRLVSEALLAARAARPSLDIKVYLDGQEYLGKSTHDDQVAELNTCLAAAGTDVKKQQDCQDSGFLYSYQVSQAGIALRYKYYAYRWDYSYAPQMHNKYFIVDGKTLITGSYNLSDNAEHNTFENMLVLRAPTYGDLIAKYEASFAKIWATDGSGALLAALKQKIASEPVIPIVFAPMALTWQQVSDLKTQIASACPAVNSAEYRQAAASHLSCKK